MAPMPQHICTHAHTVAEFSRFWIKCGACGAAGPALPAPGSALGRPARRARADPDDGFGHITGSFTALRQPARPSPSLLIVPFAVAASMPPSASQAIRVPPNIGYKAVG